MPAPMPASWLRASVAIAKPREASSTTANQPRANSRAPVRAWRRREAGRRDAGDVRPEDRHTDPEENVMTSPTPTITAIAANIRSM